MRTKLSATNNAYNIIKKYELLRLNSYQNPGDVPTIGYGHTSNVQLGQTISKQQANDFLISDVADTVNQLNHFLPDTTPAINQNQFDALVDLVFEIGIGKFLGSHLFTQIKSNPYSQTTIEPWIACWRIANGKINDTMVNRRTDDINLYFTK